MTPAVCEPPGRPPRGGVDRNGRTSGEGAHAFLDWLTVVARDEIESRWPHVEKVAQALMRERTLTAAEVKSLLAAQ